ncbi:MAG: M3 family oligoendopeptidase [Hyphomonadaceae bacterium]|nr:M3 family oligoendopeptidase [Hyphomonadaceae bacterium]
MPVWNLDDLYPGPHSEAVAADLRAAGAEARAILERYQGKLGELAKDGARLAEAVIRYEALSDTLGKLGSYAGLLYAADTANPEYAKFYGDIQEKITAITTDLIFFELEINKIDDQVLARALEAPALARYQPWFDDLRKEKPYQLDEQLERLFHEKSTTARNSWNRLFNETMTALRFDMDGEKEPLALEPTLNFLMHPDARKRRAAAEALAKVFKENIRLFTLITNTLAKDKEISDRWRGFKDVADSRHLANRVEREVVEALVTSVRAAYPRTSHRYYAMKAKWLGQPKLAYWDRNAPLPDRPERIVTWSEAEGMVLGAYGAFAPRMASIAKRFFDGAWIDAPVREGKSPGAFSHPTVPSVHPYILMNYQGKARDVMTLAHELGHGVHQVLAAPLGPLLAPTPLTLAETASVFGEMLTFKALLATTANAAEKKALLAQKVEDMINTVVRQIAFYTFERRVHEARKAGELTSEKLGEIWLDVQSESLGPAIELAEGYESYWSYVPHFIHSPFYVYAYAFGDCLVNSLYGLYQDAHPGFVEKYFAMLEAGGSKHHSELLKPFGLDASQRAFWDKGLQVIESMIDELERL